MSRVATAAALAPAFAGWPGLREVYLDLPGHGDSPVVGPADSQSVLDAVCQWIEGHVEASVLLAGCSYGGYLAAGIARQRPDLVRGLLLVCPGVRTGPADRDLPTDGPPSAEPGWLDAAPVELRGHLDRALGRRTHKVVAAVLEALAAGGPGDEGYQDALTDGPGYALHDQEEEFAFAGPVAVVVGRNDRIVGYEDQFRALRHFPRATYSLLDRAGHYLPYEQPELLRAMTQNWLGRCRA
jgi:pimeloyl-ACP methyl ester carboxylesterase